jgi:multiple sugar transport system substrate-binding protein
VCIKKLTRRWLSLFLVSLIVVLMALAVGGCKGKTAAANKPVKLTMWTLDFDPFYTPQSQIAANYLKENPNINVKVSKIGDYWNKAAASIAANQAPDIIYWMSREMYMYYVGGKFDPVPAPTSQNMTSTYFEPALNWFSYNGKYYGIPDDYNVEGFAELMINKTLMQQHNLTIPQEWIDNGGPKTADEVLQFAKKIAVKDAKGKVTISGLVGLNDGWNALKFQALLLQENANFADTANKKLNFDTPEGVKALTLMDDWVTKEGIDDPTLGLGIDQFITNGRAFMAVAAPHWGPKALTEKANMDWVMLKFPPVFGGTPIFYVDGGWGYSVSAQCKNKTAAWDFVNYITNKDNAALVESTAGNLTPRKDLADDPRFFTNDPQARYYGPMKSIMQYGQGFPTFILDLGFENTTVQDEITNVYQGKETVEQALKNMDDKVNKNIADKWATFG